MGSSWAHLVDQRDLAFQGKGHASAPYLWRGPPRYEYVIVSYSKLQSSTWYYLVPTIDRDLFFLGLDKAVSLLVRIYRCILTKRYPVEYWRRLWSSVNFDDHSLRSCVNVIHVDLVEIWNLNDKAGVGLFPYLLRLLLMGHSISRAMGLKPGCLISSSI
jgi:hypothetical protein